MWRELSVVLAEDVLADDGAQLQNDAAEGPLTVPGFPKDANEVGFTGSRSQGPNGALWRTLGAVQTAPAPNGKWLSRTPYGCAGSYTLHFRKGFGSRQSFPEITARRDSGQGPSVFSGLVGS